MKELETVLVAFRDITQCDAAVWSAPAGDLNAVLSHEAAPPVAAGD